MRYSWAIVGVVALLSGCSTSTLTSTSAVTATSTAKDISTQAAKTLTLNQQFVQHGYDDGCKDALNNQWQPSKTILEDMKGVEKMQYVEGWKQGYKRCVIGLGPVVINDTMPILHQKK